MYRYILQVARTQLLVQGKKTAVKVSKGIWRRDALRVPGFVSHGFDVNG